MVSPSDRDKTRRRQILSGGCAIGALSLLGCGRAVEGLLEIPSESGELRLAFAEHPELQEPGGSVLLRADGKGKPILVRNAGGELVALSLKCTHLGCAVSVDETAGDLACPCHGSRFTLEGAPTKGPAREPLTRLAVVSSPETVVIQLA